MWIYPGFSPSLSIYPINNQKANFKPSRKMDCTGYSMETSCLLVNLKLIAFRFGVDWRWYILAFLLLDFCRTYISFTRLHDVTAIHFIKEYTLSKHFQSALQRLCSVAQRAFTFRFFGGLNCMWKIVIFQIGSCEIGGTLLVNVTRWRNRNHRQCHHLLFVADSTTVLTCSDNAIPCYKFHYKVLFVAC